MRSILLHIKKYINYHRLNVTSCIRKLILHLSVKRDRVSHLKRNINVKHKWHGNCYGGFYLIPDILNENSIVYSFGVGKDISFDLSIIGKYNCQVFAFDPTPVSVEWVQSQKTPSNFTFFNYGIDTQTGTSIFYINKNPKTISGSVLNNYITNDSVKIVVPMKSFQSIVQDLNHNHIHVVKLDIEGAEYSVLENILNTPITIDQILVEFHDRLINNSSIPSKHITELMANHGYYIYGTSISYEEISFVHERVISQIN